jgi:putative transposase
VGFAPSTYYAAAGREPSARAKRDERLKGEILRVYLENYQVYGARKIYKRLGREGIEVARRTVERLMRVLGIAGVVRGRRRRTTEADPANPVPEDLLKRDFTAPAPNRRWVADFTQVGIRVADVYVAFIIDCYSRYIVGWQCAYHMRTELVLDALEMALSNRAVHKGHLIHRSDHGSQYLSIRYTAALAAADVTMSAGTVGDSYDNALAESVNGLFKAELIRRHGPWRDLAHLERSIMDWVDWYNNRRLHSWCGDVPPAEYEATYNSGEDQSTGSAEPERK